MIKIRKATKSQAAEVDKDNLSEGEGTKNPPYHYDTEK